MDTCKHDWQPRQIIWRAQKMAMLPPIDLDAPVEPVVLKAYGKQGCRRCGWLRIIDQFGGVEWQGGDRAEAELKWRSLIYPNAASYPPAPSASPHST